VHVFHKRGTARYTLGYDWIEFGEGLAEHGYAPELRGSEGPPEGAFVVYLTTFTPISRTLRITGGRGM
jgi:hypothetical protein